MRMGGGASKGKRGPVDRKGAKGPKSTMKHPKGFDPKGEHPQNKGTGNRKMNRVLKGVDKSKGTSKMVGDKSNKLDGKYF